MVYDIISARVADVHDELKKLLSHLDEFPNSESVKQVAGPDASVTAPFSSTLVLVAMDASRATKVVMKELANADSTVRAALNDLAAQDDAFAMRADQAEAALTDASSAASAARTDDSKYV